MRARCRSESCRKAILLKAWRDTLPEGLIVDHPDMPVFRLSLDEVDALIDYLEEIQATQTALLGQSVQVLN